MNGEIIVFADFKRSFKIYFGLLWFSCPKTFEYFLNFGNDD